MAIADFDIKMIKLFFPETVSIPSFLLMSDRDSDPAPHKTLQKILGSKQGQQPIKTLKSLQTLHDSLMQWTDADPEKWAEVPKPDLNEIWSKDYERQYASIWEVILSAWQDMNWDELFPLAFKTIGCLDRQRSPLDKAVKSRNRNNITKSLHLAYAGSLPPQVKSISKWLTTQKSHSDFPLLPPISALYRSPTFYQRSTPIYSC